MNTYVNYSTPINACANETATGWAPGPGANGLVNGTATWDTTFNTLFLLNLNSSTCTFYSKGAWKVNWTPLTTALATSTIFVTTPWYFNATTGICGPSSASTASAP